MYIGDVPVESSYHGSALLYRLFSDYVPDKLRIIDTGLQEYVGSERLADVRYATVSFGNPRLLRSRLHRPYGALLALTFADRWRKAAAAVRDFATEAIITVAHGYGWIIAAALAQHENLPLHLIVHDDWPHTTNVRLGKNRLDSTFRGIYLQARTRLCVSPYMEREYRARYDVKGTVLFPSRAKNQAVALGASERTTRDKDKLTFAFAGTINSQGYARLLASLAANLSNRGGELIIFGPFTRDDLRKSGLALPNVRLGGLVPTLGLLDALREQADVLVVPMSFEGGGHKDNMRLSFPSKLADYTAAGLPLLIWGPSYSSAVRWAQERSGVAEVVISEDGFDLQPALDRLGAASHRRTLAEKALEVGDALFSHASAQRVFRAAIAGSNPLRKEPGPCA